MFFFLIKKKKKKKKSRSPGTVQADAYPCQREHGMVPWVKMFPAQSLSTHHSDLVTSGTKCPDFCLDSEVHVQTVKSSLVLKIALFTIIIIIESAPSTATRSKIAWVFGDRPGIFLPLYLWWWQIFNFFIFWAGEKNTLKINTSYGHAIAL